MPAGRYLKYAIGEILLVVIGILIALSINNWNENRKDRNQERELLNQLQSEFQSNLDQLDEKISLRENMISASLTLLDVVDYPEKRNSDSILTLIGNTLLAPTFDPIVNDIISSGRIQYLGNSSLKEKLSRWTSEIVQVTEEEDVWLNYRSNIYIPTLLKYSSFRTIINEYWQSNLIGSFHIDKGSKSEFTIGKSINNVHISELLDHSKFEDHIAQCASFAKLTNSQSMSLRKRIVDILQLIENELKK